MNKLGMTKIEVLVIALIIGILGVAAVISVTNARAATRDAVRLSDVRQTQAALELYFNDFNEYPLSTDPLALGQASTSCFSENGFSASCTPSLETVYMEVVSSTPSAGLSGASSCSGLSNGYCYTGANGQYRVQFELERDNPLLGLESGLNCATESEIEPGACPELTVTGG